MFKTLYHKTEALYNKKIDGMGLAIFRILYSLALLGDVCYLYYFRHLIFDKTPYISVGEIDMSPIIFVWILSLIFIVLGLFTRTATIVNYIISVGVIGTISSYQYHMFFSYLSLNFILMFLPISRCFSLDRLIKKIKYSNTRFKYIPSRDVSVLTYYAPIVLGIGFVYFDSVFYKYCSHLWLSGLGLWLPGSLPQDVIFNNSFLLNIKFLVIALGYLTLAFETIFIFVFFRKKWRVPILIIGVGLHLGILLFFPIPFFALGVVAIYSLMIPVSVWKRSHKHSNDKLLKFYYDAECPLCNRIVIVIDHFDRNKSIEFLSVQQTAASELAFKNITQNELLTDIYVVDQKQRVYKGLDSYLRVLSAIWYLKPVSWILRIPGIYHIAKAAYRYIAVNRITERCTDDNCGYVPPIPPANESTVKIFTNLTLQQLKLKVFFCGILFLSALQIIVSYNSPLCKSVRKKLGISKVGAVKLSESISDAVMHVSEVYLGIAHHGVFVDGHFKGYNHDIAVVYISPKGVETWLPIIDKTGLPGRYLIGPVWTKWTFRVNGPAINPTKLADGIKDFTAFWAYKNGISLNNAVFEIRVKKNLEPKQWEYNFLNNQLKNPWLPGGNVTWKNGTFSANIVNVEAL